MRRLVPWGAILLAACQSTWGSLLVRVDLTQDSRTQCISMALNERPPQVLPRQGKSLLRVAITESKDLTGEISVAVLRFAQEDCTEPIGTAVVKTATLSRNREDALTFVFRDEPTEPERSDGGTDAGADAGADGGCTPSACAEPPACRLAATACLGPGECDHPLAPKGTSCDGGLCSEHGACLAPCAVLEEGSTCDDGLACTIERCAQGACVGACNAAPPACHIALPACHADGGCALAAMPDDTACTPESADAGRHQCRDGRCERTLPFAPRNLEDHVSAFPAPVDRWTLEPGCTAVIDTGLSPPRPRDGGWCASIGPAAATLPLARDGGEAAMLSMASLNLPAGSELHFIGPRPVVLVVLDDATVAGLLSVAPHIGSAPAGSNPPECLEHHLGVNALESEGGGGAAYGAAAGLGGGADGGSGRGGDAWGAGGLLEPLRGGCTGGTSPDGGLGGLGGGALQLSVGGHLVITETGVITASGGGGGGASAPRRGGGGGGSGGAVLLEASALTQLGFVTTNGGGGGEGSDLGAPASAGLDGALTAVSAATGGASLAGGAGGSGGAALGKGGSDGANTSLSGGGGGGSVGRIRLRAPVMNLATERLSGQLRVD